MSDSTEKPDDDLASPGAHERLREPPIGPEALLDVVQAVGALSSDNAAHKEFGGWVCKQYFDELPKQYGSDETAQQYLREVLAATASAVRGFSVERTVFRRARTREDRIEDLRSKLIEPKFFSSPVDGQSASTIYGLAAKILPSGGGAAILYFTDVLKGHPWWQLSAFVIGVLWLLRGDFLLTALTIRLQISVFRRFRNGHQETADLWHDSVPRYKALAVDLLISTERIRERYYPHSTALIPEISWLDVPPGDLADFVASPNSALRGRSPLEVLSAIVDMRFSLDRSVPQRYVPRAKPPQEMQAHPSGSGPVRARLPPASSSATAPESVVTKPAVTRLPAKSKSKQR